MKTRILLRSLATLGVGIVLFFSCAVNPVSGKKEFMLMSTAQELQLGASYDPQVIEQFGLYNDQKLQDFINLHGAKMGRVSHRPELNYQFRVLDSPVVNAFAVPGGYVYFTRGIMAHFNNEAEFAGVLGHEIGHVAARHSAKQYSSTVLAQFGLGLGMALSKEFQNYSDMASSVLGLVLLSHSRKHESESDKLGVAYSTAVGYDAHQMANFFRTIQRLQTESGGGIPTMLSTHPDPGDRFNTVHQLAEKEQKKTGKTDLLVKRNEYLKKIDGIVYGEDPRQGYVDGGVFYHPELRFQFPVPSSWKLVNMPSQVQMAPEGGKAAMLFTLASEKTLAQATSAAIARDSLKVINQRNTRINGNDAVEVTADLNEKVRVLLTLISYGGNIYRFTGLAVTADFNTYKPYFSKTTDGFKSLSDPARLGVLPERIAIETVQSDGTLEQALRSFKMPADRLDELAILNGMLLSDRVSKGSLIKVIRKD